jgi:3-dehydroquinate synthase
VQAVTIDLGDRSYRIAIDAGLIVPGALWDEVPRATHALIVTNETVAPLYLQTLRNALAGRYAHIHQVILPDGEVHKDWQTLNLIFDALLENGCDRKTVLFALGGGVVGDMTGFAAASYMRGGGEDGYQPPAGQEHDRRFLPASVGGVRPCAAVYAART